MGLFRNYFQKSTPPKPTSDQSQQLSGEEYTFDVVGRVIPTRSPCAIN
jgi:hypothetical protein